jgi:hypothetical protein
METDRSHLSDLPPVAELVECAPPPEPEVSTPLPEDPDSSPSEAAAQATIENTGADPPPSREGD